MAAEACKFSSFFLYVLDPQAKKNVYALLWKCIFLLSRHFRIVVSNLHKETKKVFSEVVKDLYQMKSHGRPTPMISEQHYKIIMANADRLNSAIVYDRDFSYQYFGFKTLEESSIKKVIL